MSESTIDRRALLKTAGVAAVGFATSAFFIAAGVRLYQDLSQIAAAEAALNGAVVLPPTAPLPSITA